jgi:hypothetical protein
MMPYSQREPRHRANADYESGLKLALWVANRCCRQRRDRKEEKPTHCDEKEAPTLVNTTPMGKLLCMLALLMQATGEHSECDQLAATDVFQRSALAMCAMRYAALVAAATLEHGLAFLPAAIRTK